VLHGSILVQEICPANQRDERRTNDDYRSVMPQQLRQHYIITQGKFRHAAK
jgi:hypothetical protein